MRQPELDKLRAVRHAALAGGAHEEHAHRDVRDAEGVGDFFRAEAPRRVIGDFPFRLGQGVEVGDSKYRARDDVARAVAFESVDERPAALANAVQVAHVVTGAERAFDAPNGLAQALELRVELRFAA